MVKKANKPKHHHYVPRFNLEFFSDSGFVWVYDSHNNTYNKLPIERVAVINNFYTFTTDKGKKLYEIEEYLSKVEGVSKPLIQKLDSGNDLTDEEKAGLSEYLYLQMYRTPKNIRRTLEGVEKMTKKMMSITASNKQYFERTIEEIESKHEDMKKIDSEAVRRDLVNQDYNLHVPKEWALKFMFDSLPELVGLIFASEWQILHSPKNTMFITSDDPYTQVQTKKLPGFYRNMMGLGVKGTEITVALTPNTCLLLLPKDGNITHRKLNKDGVKNVNFRTATNCDRFIFSKNEDLLKRMVKRTEVWKYRPLKDLVSVS